MVNEEAVETSVSAKQKMDWKWLENLFLFLAVGYGVLYFLSLSDLSFLKGEILAYSLECEVKPQYNSCPGKTLFALRATHYKPNKDRQEVLSWVEGFPPERLTDCAVVDRTNWQCSFNDKSSTFGFRNGIYFDNPAVDKEFYKQFYVSRSKWIRRDCEDSIFSAWYCIPLHDFLRGD